MRAQRAGDAIASFNAIPLALRLENVVASYAIYLYRTFWPMRLAIIYPFRIQGLATFQVACSLAVVLGISAFPLWRLRQQPYIAVGWFWFLGALVPVVGLVQVGVQASADRYVYVPLIGVFIALAWGAGECVERFPQAKTWVLVATAAWLILLGFRTRDQIQYWHNSKALFHRAIDVVDDNFVAYNHLGQTLEIEGHSDEAYSYYFKALQIKPNILYSSTLFNVGALKLTQKKPGEAVHYFEEALNYPAGMRSTLIIHQTLGAAFEAEHDFQHAEKQYREVMRLSPERANNTRLNLAILVTKQGRYDDAIILYRENLIRGEDPWLYFLLGTVQEAKGDLAGAEQSLKAALRMQPKNAQYQKELKDVLSKKRGEGTIPPED